MIVKSKTKFISVLMVISIFFFQNCATIIRGTSQNIPVTSIPIGAKIIVDGEAFRNIIWIRIKCADSEKQECIDLW